ncbi:hypothetical protein EV401DRAFT_1878893 [Pisolithus croceorrhizus]|nr:hypothetical protein EV401DRAFT_1878893 [Pisolithus croceorrhizus]
MASVEVVRGIAGESTRADRKGGKNRGSVFGVGWFAGKDHGDKKGKDSESSLGFTSHRPPPGYVGGNAVLVQVWAVGLDGTDARLVGIPSPRISVAGSPGIRYGRKVAKASEKEKLRTPPVGYIPGRSFVGRVLEAGWEVREDIVKRGDWVVGLASVQKCGALAEFVLVDRHRIHRVPQPHVLRRTPYSTDNPALPLAIGHASVSRDAVAGRGTSLPSGTDVLTVEELALLPLSGVPAYRAIRTFPHVSGPMGAAHRQGLAQSTLRPLVPPVGDGGVFPDSQGGDVPAAHQARDSRPRALVLRGHDGPGALAVQILVREGWCVWAHVPVPFTLPGPALEVTGELRDEEGEKESERRRAALRRIEERLRGWGVDEQGSVAALLAYLTRCCVRVDAVLDTVGGREVWEVGRALLSLPVQEWEVTSNYRTEQARGEGQAQFTTLLGDAPDRVVASAGDNFKAGVRALGIGGPKDHRQSKTLDLHDPFDALSCGGRNAYDSFSLPETKGKIRNTTKKKIKPRAVNYSWVSLASDIDWEGGDVCDSLREVLKLAADYGVRPAADQLDFPPSFCGTSASGKGKKKAVLIGGDNFDDEAKVVPFENTPELFVSGGKLEYGGTVVSRIVG